MQYNNINISINGNNILANSVNITESSPTKPLFSFNNNVVYNAAPSTLQNKISINYFLEPINEPNFPILTGIIVARDVEQPSLINIANIYTTGYLNNFSLKLLPNSLVAINAEFNVFYPFTGNFIPQNPSDSGLYDTQNSSGLAHYWAANFTSGNNINLLNNNILQMEYSANVNIIPIYGIGSPMPQKIYLDGIKESISILSELQNPVNYSGKLLNNIFTGINAVVLNNISTLWSASISNNITIYMTGFIQEDSSCDISPDNLIFFNLKFSKYS